MIPARRLRHSHRLLTTDMSQRTPVVGHLGTSQFFLRGSQQQPDPKHVSPTETDSRLSFVGAADILLSSRA
jgi:hypothetical protein